MIKFSNKQRQLLKKSDFAPLKLNYGRRSSLRRSPFMGCRVHAAASDGNQNNGRLDHQSLFGKLHHPTIKRIEDCIRGNGGNRDRLKQPPEVDTTRHHTKWLIFLGDWNRGK